MKISLETKFEPGDKAWYCSKVMTECSDLVEVHINSVDIKYDGKEYVIRYEVSGPGEFNLFMANEKDLYKSKIVITDIERRKKKKKLTGEEKFANDLIQQQIVRLEKIKEQLDEIKKEELTIELAGISTDKQ